MRFLRYLGSVMLNLLFHWYWSIPAWILLILHFVVGISIWWFVGALVLWIVCVQLYAHFVGALVRYGNIPEKEKENKNPYSKK